MKHSHTTTTTANVSPGEVWDVLEDFAEYPRWNNVVPRAAGALRKGTWLHVSACLGAPARRFRLKVVSAREPGDLFMTVYWVHPRLLHLRYSITIEEAGTRQAKIQQWWHLRGLLAARYWPRVRDRLDALERMAQRLAHEAERKWGDP